MQMQTDLCIDLNNIFIYCFFLTFFSEMQDYGRWFSRQHDSINNIVCPGEGRSCFKNSALKYSSNTLIVCFYNYTVF